MNRRRHPRLEIDIPAVIEYRGQLHDACRMLNFSRGGAYLQCLDEGLHQVLPEGYITGPERPEASLSLPGESIRVAVDLVYYRNNGLGLSFRDDSGKKLYELLHARIAATDAAAPPEAGKRAIDATESRELLTRIKDRAGRFLKANLPSFFQRALQDLQQLIAETTNREEESALFYALNTLEKDQPGISERFLAWNKRGFSDLLGEAPDKPAAGRGETPVSGELALVDTREIDVWILVNDTARRVESELSRPLYQIEIALSYLCQGNIHNELNPLSPISLLSGFKRVLDEYEFDTKTLRLLLKAFRRSLLGELHGLYDELIQLLHSLHIVGLEQGHPSRHGVVVQSPQQGEGDGTPLGHIAALGLRGGRAGTQPVMTDAEREEVLSGLASLSHLQAATLQQQIERLLQQETTQPVKLSPAARAAIGAGEDLVAELIKDPLITPELRLLLGSLKFLIIEAVLQDTSLLDNESHPVRLLLESIESLKPYLNTGPHASLIRDRESHRLTLVAKAVENGQFEHVDEVTREIRSLQREQRERFEHNRKLAISRCLKDEKLRQAQLSTYQAMSELLLQGTVPNAVDSLLRFGWVNLLVQTAVLEKVGGKQWHAYLHLIKLLKRIFSGHPSAHPMTDGQRNALLSIVRKGFSDYPIHIKDARGFMQTLEETLSSGKLEESGLAEPVAGFDAACLQGYFRDMCIQREQAQREETAWWKAVEETPLDTWLIEQDGQGGTRVLSLAWKHPSTHRYLLVDGDGFMALDEEIAALAARFANGQIAAMELPAQPIVERTIESMLSNTYNGFKLESSIDPLTGLSNRRAFEVELGKRLSRLASDGPSVLLLIDLDKFQVVNDLCGLEGGDNLLQTVTDILLSYLPDRGLLARIGDDEFCLLLDGHDLEQGYQAAELLRMAIDEYDFEWQGRMIPSSASVGMVQIESVEQVSGTLMQAALAACSMAKQGGGNCTRIYLASDSAYQDRQQLLQSLPAIKEALSKGRMELFVQPIVPLRDSAAMPLHHEILLRIRNDEGELEAPQEFVRAAEQYDLMRSVDRWVVEAFFALLEPYADRLPEGYSFSINLSGKSMGDGDFKRFLTERIGSSRLSTRHLGFEITETALVGDISDTAAFIQEIRDLGCSFSLDDFGSGYASFSYLRDFPVDFVKIDGVFVREILNKPADYAMINSITEIAHFMDKQVIAEYVSGEEIGLALKSIGVDYGQGYHFGKPRALKEVLLEFAGEVQEQRIGET